MPSVCYNPNYYLQNCVYLYLVPILLNRIGNLLAYVVSRTAFCHVFASVCASVSLFLRLSGLLKCYVLHVSFDF